MALSNWDSRSLFVALPPCSGAAARGAVAGAVQQASRRRGGRCGGSGGGGGTRGGGAGWGAHHTGERGACSPPTPVRRPCCGCAAAAAVLWPRLLQALPEAPTPVCVRVPMHLTMHATPQVDPGEHYGEDAAAAGGGDKRPTGGQSRCPGWPCSLCRRCAAAACRLPAESCCSRLQYVHRGVRGMALMSHGMCACPLGTCRRQGGGHHQAQLADTRLLRLPSGASRGCRMAAGRGPLRPLCQLSVPAVPAGPAAAPCTLRCPCLPACQSQRPCPAWASAACAAAQVCRRRRQPHTVCAVLPRGAPLPVHPDTDAAGAPLRSPASPLCACLSCSMLHAKAVPAAATACLLLSPAHSACHTNRAPANIAPAARAPPAGCHAGAQAHRGGH